MAKMLVSNNQISSPAWAGDFISRDHLVPGGANVNPELFNAANAVAAAVIGDHNANAVSVNVAPLSGSIPAGAILRVDRPGVFARLATPAAEGDVALNVEPLSALINDGSTAIYEGTGKKVVQSGTAIGRTFDERDGGEAFGLADAGDEEIYLVAFENPDVERNPVVELYRHGSVVKENFLPNFASLVDSGVIDFIRANYTTTIGEA
ncbi:MAG: hypothetical protein IAF02_25120 [Anaerolineae bacterium]|nr:hypothetical protein [Anaerolineae bacterium]